MRDNKYTNLSNFKYKYNDDDSIYDIDKNHNNWDIGNLFIILSKYDFDLYSNASSMTDKDNKEILKIMMYLYEDFIDQIDKLLLDFMVAMISYKYNHRIEFIAEIEIFRNRLRKISRNIEDDNPEELKNFIKNNLFSVDRLHDIYYDALDTLYGLCCSNNNYSEYVNIGDDLNELTDINIFKLENTLEFLDKYCVDKERLQIEIKNHIGGLFDDEYC